MLLVLEVVAVVRELLGELSWNGLASAKTTLATPVLAPVVGGEI